MNTRTCPRCHQPINSQAVTCPHCRIELKAYGHPGIPLHRATGKEYLCKSCIYHDDNSCTFPQRPFAKECTLYENVQARKLELQQQNLASSKMTLRSWIERNQGLLLLLALLLICFLITLFNS